MLLFVVPLQSPEVSKDWALVSRLAVRSIASMCAQDHPDFRVILACSERPLGLPDHPKLTVIEVDRAAFPPPVADRTGRMIDKFRKFQRALITTREFTPAHILFCDADDCVSRRLAGFCAAQPQARGWYFKRGYIWDEGTRFAFALNDFDLFCGTSALVRCEADELLDNMEEPHGNCFYLSHAHPILRDSMAERGTPLEPLPFPGAVYVTGTGENDSGATYRHIKSRRLWLQKWLKARYVTNGFRREFGLWPLASVKLDSPEEGRG